MKLTLILILFFVSSGITFSQSTSEEEKPSKTLSVVKKSKLRSTKVILYPNPAVDQFSIKTDRASETELVIYNSRGQKQAFEPVISGNTILVDVSTYDPGNYYVVINNPETSETRRLVIRRN